MRKTAADVRQTLVPSSPLLPLERLGFSIATKRALSREFFNTIGQEQTVANFPQSGPSRIEFDCVGPVAQFFNNVAGRRIVGADLATISPGPYRCRVAR